MLDGLENLPGWQRAGFVIAVAILAHLVVHITRRLSATVMESRFVAHISKTRTIISLVTSALVFSTYFAALGFALSEAGISLTTYVASASIIGLAVAFGSQGLVQDVVSGLTIVFTNLFDIGDVVEIGGQVGVVQNFGMRFTVLRSPLGAQVYVPNRSITNIVSYPRGYIRCFADVMLPEASEHRGKIEMIVHRLANAASEQFPGIARAPAEVTGPHRTSVGSSYMRIKFRIWPGRGAPLEGPFRQGLLQAVRAVEPTYADWMVSLTYEVEPYSPPRRRTAKH